MKKAVLIILILSLILLTACNVRFSTPKATPMPDPMPEKVHLEHDLTAVLEGAEGGQDGEETFNDPDAPTERTLILQDAVYTLTYKQSVRAFDGSVRQEYAVKDFSVPLTVLYQPEGDYPYGASLPAVLVPVNLRTVDPEGLVVAIEKLLGGALPQEVKHYACAVTRNDDAVTEFSFYEQLDAYRRLIAVARYVGSTVTLTVFGEIPVEADIAVLQEGRTELREAINAVVPSAEEAGEPYIWWEDGVVMLVTYTTDEGTYRYRLYRDS